MNVYVRLTPNGKNIPLRELPGEVISVDATVGSVEALQIRLTKLCEIVGQMLCHDTQEEIERICGVSIDKMRKVYEDEEIDIRYGGKPL